MYHTPGYNSGLGTAGHRASNSISYLNNFNLDHKKRPVAPTSSHYFPPPPPGMHQSSPAHSALQPSIVGIVPPPPMAIQNPLMMNMGLMNPPPQYAPPYQHPHPLQMAPPSHHLHPQAPAQQAQQPPTGGINSVLEYDLTNMSTFLSWCAFGMLKQNRNPTKDFEGLVNSVLFATRLPKSTIIIALEYMNQRFSSKGINTLSESEIFIKLIVGLILGNKFNDDNTFTNRSWCGATGLQISVLNEEEMTWLQEVKWNLNVVNFESNIITLEECWKTWLEKYTPKDVSVSTYSSPVYSNPSIPSSPVSPDYNVYYPSSSPTLPYSNSSPTKYSDAMWNPQQPVPHLAVQSLPSNANVNHHQHQHQHQHQNSIWSYTPNYPNNLPISHQPIQYLNSNFVGYTNPYYTFNMASC